MRRAATKGDSWAIRSSLLPMILNHIRLSSSILTSKEACAAGGGGQGGEDCDGGTGLGTVGVAFCATSSSKSGAMPLGHRLYHSSLPNARNRACSPWYHPGGASTGSIL